MIVHLHDGLRTFNLLDALPKFVLTVYFNDVTSNPELILGFICLLAVENYDSTFCWIKFQVPFVEEMISLV